MCGESQRGSHHIVGVEPASRQISQHRARIFILEFRAPHFPQHDVALLYLSALAFLRLHAEGLALTHHFQDFCFHFSLFYRTLSCGILNCDNKNTLHPEFSSECSAKVGRFRRVIHLPYVYPTKKNGDSYFELKISVIFWRISSKMRRCLSSAVESEVDRDRSLS